MNSEEAILRLEQKGVKPTANRIIVYRTLAAATHPMSLTDMERLNLSLDKSSIFRVLTQFLEHDVVHSFEDGRGILNYELCHSRGACTMKDNHVHFYCESCQQSFCLEDIHIHGLHLPEGFTPHSFSFVVKGECPECRKKHS